MSFDFDTSRRGYNEYCTWWDRNESDTYDNNEWVKLNAPTGTFWAKEMTQISDDDQTFGGVFRVGRTNVVIKTKDNISKIKNECLVMFQGELWRVSGIGRKRLKGQSTEFAREIDTPHVWVMNLRK